MFLISMLQLIWGYIVYQSCESTGNPGTYIPSDDNPFAFFCTNAPDGIFWAPLFITVYVNVCGVVAACGLRHKALKMEDGSSTTKAKGNNFY